jgi:hypothetical protein
MLAESRREQFDLLGFVFRTDAGSVLALRLLIDRGDDRSDVDGELTDGVVHFYVQHIFSWLRIATARPGGLEIISTSSFAQ